MWMRSAGAGIQVLAPAKVNLFLEVLKKRPDGFHEIETLMYPVGLWDTLFFQPQETPKIDFSVDICLPSSLITDRDSAVGDLPLDSKNLVVRAVELLRFRAEQTSPKKIPGARIHLVKRIPWGAGLGGGSSDAAAALLAANKSWKLGWTKNQLQDLGAELGSDIPYFFSDNPAICRGRGEKIEPLSGLGCLQLVIVRPPQGLATAEVYRACRPSEKPREAFPLVQALRSGRLAEAGSLLHNQLFQAARGLSDWVEKLNGELSRLDCLGVLMSGSGSSFFLLCRHALHARRLAEKLRSRNLGGVFAVPGCC